MRDRTRMARGMTEKKRKRDGTARGYIKRERETNGCQSLLEAWWGMSGVDKQTRWREWGERVDCVGLEFCGLSGSVQCDRGFSFL